MIYSVLADIVAALHFGYVGFVVVGELLILIGIALGWKWIRNIWFRVPHLLAMLYPAFEMFSHIECPLTVWEYYLRKAANQEAVEGSFVGRLINNLMMFNLGDDSWVWLWIYGGMALLIVLTFVLAPPRWKRKLPAQVVTAT
jgi:hypothetical protein